MKKLLPKRALIGRGLAAGLAIMSFATIADANPFASSLTNNAGVVSFRLNQTTTTNDLVQIISSGGTVTNVLQAPGNNVIARGLVVTNLGIAPGTFQVRIKHIGGGVIALNGPSVPFGTIRGLAANRNPGSPYFGWVYVSNSGSNAAHGQGIFALGADLSDINGQGSVPGTGGYPGFIGANAGSSPYSISVAPDDTVLVCDWTDSSGNLIAMPPLLNSYSYLLKQLQGVAAAPVGSNNNHGSLVSAIIVGSGANTKLYTVDEDYQRDPASGIANEWNSLWQYNIGTNYTGVSSLQWSNAPDKKLMTPYINSFSGQNMSVQSGPNGYLYVNQRRANPPQYDVFVVDPANPVDPNSYTGIGGFFWDTQTESIAEGYSDDVMRDTMHISVSADGRYLAGIIAAGNGNVTAPDGSSAATVANEIIVIPLTNGIPNIPARQIFKLGGAANGRDLAFDAADNLICGSSGLAYIQALDLGESTDATTGSDGTFNVVRPATQASVAATSPVAFEKNAVPGVFTITRTPDDIGNPLTVFYKITGTAANTHYSVGGGPLITTTNCVIAAGQTSTNILITPIEDNIPELTETVLLTIRGSGGYSLGFPSFATVAIADDSTPQLQILSLSTNIFQGNLNDYATLTIRRFGDTNVTLNLDATSFSFGGTAVLNGDYYLTNLPISIPAGVVDTTVNLIYPSANGTTAVGSRSIIANIVAGSGYTVTNGTATTTLTLQAVPPENILFSDNFETDTTGSNWNVLFASYLNGSTDYNLVFGYDYTSGSIGNLSPIPAAPHSTNGDTKGVYMTVNKNAGISAGLNLYLKNHTFGSNYALRFDMFLVQNSSGSTQSKVEDAIFGINHSGTRTNWFRNQVTGTSTPGSPTLSDGLWFDVGADGNGGGGANTDYGAWSGPTWTNGVNVVGPTNLINRLATTTRQVFKKPPFDAGPALGGSMANTVASPTPTWVQVEVSQLGNLITWKVNNTVIFSYLNNTGVNSTYTNGTVMLGYTDPWDDLGNSSAGSGEAAVIYDNVRVVSLVPPAFLSGPSSIVAAAGTTTNLSVVVSTTTGTTNYQWTKNGVNVAGATSSTLNFAPLTSASYGTYAVIVGDGAYSTTSASVTVTPPTPIINVQPKSRAAVQGSSPTFSVVATTFSGVTNYQWQYYGTNLVGKTTATLTLAGVQPISFGGPYTVTVNDGTTTITSAPPAFLTVPVRQTLTNSVSGSTLSMTFGTEFGPSYIVEYKTNLTDLTWTTLTTKAGTGNPATATDSLTSAPTRFYRIRLQ